LPLLNHCSGSSPTNFRSRKSPDSRVRDLDGHDAAELALHAARQRCTRGCSWLGSGLEPGPSVSEPTECRPAGRNASRTAGKRSVSGEILCRIAQIQVCPKSTEGGPSSRVSN
jgi:hypothetical protein